ncbi:copper resistance CopC family protein [Ensifer aridi]|uniref:copper resistance CopC family protein n=1 Tax=Ensifer aridi TaxID=1708715 RepID=UPI001FCD7746|nr:copper resistance protein CopC [Ensifer aridi]
MVHMSPSFSRLARLMVIALLGLLAQIGVAVAHASLNTSEPNDGAVVDAAPSVYALTFSEPVSPLSLKLVRPDGASIPLDRFELKDRTVEIVAPTDLGRGTHVLSWRVISADGHPIGGSVVFSVGRASAEPALVSDHIDWGCAPVFWHHGSPSILACSSASAARSPCAGSLAALGPGAKSLRSHSALGCSASSHPPASRASMRWASRWRASPSRSCGPRRWEQALDTRSSSLFSPSPRRQ